MTIKLPKLTKRFAVWIIVAAAALLACIVLACSAPADGDVTTTAGRVEYLARLGWEADADSEEVEAVILPRDFSGVMGEYNDLQLEQGFDMSAYAGMDCYRYSYLLLNYPNGDTRVYAQLFVCGTRVIGGDIHSAALDGFMHSLK